MCWMETKVHTHTVYVYRADSLTDKQLKNLRKKRVDFQGRFSGLFYLSECLKNTETEWTEKEIEIFTPCFFRFNVSVWNFQR